MAEDEGFGDNVADVPGQVTKTEAAEGEKPPDQIEDEDVIL